MKSNASLGLTLVAILLGGLLLTACGDATITPNPPGNSPVSATSTPVPAIRPSPTTAPPTQLKVVSVDELTLPTNGTAYLSPDGKLIAWISSKELCLYTSTGQKQNCITDKVIDDSSVRWSPDSTHLVFTEDFYRNRAEPDIWVMEAAKGTLSDLTEDGQSGFIKFDALDKAESIDLLPSWSADSKSILFIRYRNGEKVIILDLYTVTADGKSKAVKVGELNSYHNETSGLILAPDSKKIAYSKGFDNTEKEPGIWLADLSGKNPKRLLKEYENNPSLGQFSYFDIEYSADGKYILGINFAAQGLSQTYEANSNSRVAAIDSSGEFEVASDKQAWWAGWSPKGSALIYLVYDKEKNGLLLYMVDKPGSIGRAIYDQPLKPYPTRFRGLSWAANNTLLAMNRDNKAVLLHLG